MCDEKSRSIKPEISIWNIGEAGEAAFMATWEQVCVFFKKSVVSSCLMIKAYSITLLKGKSYGRMSVESRQSGNPKCGDVKLEEDETD